MCRELTFNFKKLRLTACCYVALPLLIFLIGFLKWYYALVSILALGFVLRNVVSAENTEPSCDTKLKIRTSEIALIWLVVLIWSYFGGLNGFFYQSSDWDCRNAIFHDLIEFEWPVIYESTGAALVYYIGHWLPPALIGKIVLWLTGSMQCAWFVGKMVFWVWTCFGLTIVILLMFHFLKIETGHRRAWAIFFFIFFSGMDIVGAICKGNLDRLFSPEVLHLEWWSKYQFSAITTCVYWVFNQVVIPWIVTLCFLMESDPRNYVFYIVACLLSGPLPCVGLVICMVVKTVFYCAKPGERGCCRKRLRAIFSSSNITALLFVFPFVAAYILANNALGAANVAEGTISFTKAPFFSLAYWDIELVCFLVVEVGCYLFLIFCDHKKDPLYYCLIFTFIIAPYFYVGTSNDFCMRASVPAVFILMLYVNRFLLDHFSLMCGKRVAQYTRKQICAFALMLCFAIGMATPLVELFRGIYHVTTEGTVLLEDMSIGSFDKGSVYANFNCSDPKATFFFQYIAK